MKQHVDGRLWAESFLAFLKKARYPRNPWKDAAWTEFVGKAVARVAERMGCYSRMRRKRAGKGEDSGEYFNIDAIFFDLKSYDRLEFGKDYDPFVLPQMAVELENRYNLGKISYCLWKLLCIRSPLRVLICYQKSKSGLRILPKRLSAVIKKGRLAEGDSGQLLVIVGDETPGEDVAWEEYYSAFEWRNGSLQRIHWKQGSP